eukprot:CAMPEP_0175896820 /NCGR_PEP_ID=MMETSP0108-20121206/375_1 /TAXON_ID=195067 ORGANISM="Goniomonas pacifica, Strain CCMP1869" /NCGR_SAMPLE_ID=MMETSP0108 /ASSEMBLY_ACC=CAM_ASM_000204 /LENGTH=61 /DNA_ID=CAMNT_0017218047 /DNA_START=226 /DNA_END=412 /DNA_ORIENTATION=-
MRHRNPIDPNQQPTNLHHAATVRCTTRHDVDDHKTFRVTSTGDDQTDPAMSGTGGDGGEDL